MTGGGGEDEGAGGEPVQPPHLLHPPTRELDLLRQGGRRHQAGGLGSAHPRPQLPNRDALQRTAGQKLAQLVQPVSNLLGTRDWWVRKNVGV